MGKQAASLHSQNKTKLSAAVVNVVGKEDLAPEHIKRVCEFANQSAYQNEWEKGGSVRNIEFEGGPAHPSEVMRELHDGARQDAVRVASDYDSPPTKVASADSRVEQEIFAGYTDSSPLPSEVPSGMGDLMDLRTSIVGAQDQIFSKVAGLDVTREQLELELGDEVKKAVLEGEELGKIASAWAHYAPATLWLKEAIKVAADRLVADGVRTYQQIHDSFEKTASQRIPNPEHPVVSRFIEFAKVASETSKLRSAVGVLEGKRRDAESAIKSFARG